MPLGSRCQDQPLNTGIEGQGSVRKKFYLRPLAPRFLLRLRQENPKMAHDLVHQLVHQIVQRNILPCHNL